MITFHLTSQWQIQNAVTQHVGMPILSHIVVCPKVYYCVGVLGGKMISSGLRLHFNLKRVIKRKKKWISAFYSGTDYSQVESNHYSCQSSHERMSQQIYSKVRLCNAQRDKELHLRVTDRTLRRRLNNYGLSGETERTLRYDQWLYIIMGMTKVRQTESKQTTRPLEPSGPIDRWDQHRVVWPECLKATVKHGGGGGDDLGLFCCKQPYERLISHNGND